MVTFNSCSGEHTYLMAVFCFPFTNATNVHDTFGEQFNINTSPVYYKAIWNKNYRVSLSSIRKCPWRECRKQYWTSPYQLLFLACLGQSVSMETAGFIPTTSLSCATCTAEGSVRNTMVLEYVMFRVLCYFYCCLHGTLPSVHGPAIDLIHRKWKVAKFGICISGKDISVMLYSRVVFIRL